MARLAVRRTKASPEGSPSLRSPREFARETCVYTTGRFSWVAAVSLRDSGRPPGLHRLQEVLPALPVPGTRAGHSWPALLRHFRQLGVSRLAGHRSLHSTGSLWLGGALHNVLRWWGRLRWLHLLRTRGGPRLHSPDCTRRCATTWANPATWTTPGKLSRALRDVEETDTDLLAGRLALLTG